MTRTLAIGLALFLLFAIVLAPAGLLRVLIPDASGVDLLEASGTLWNGSGELYLAGNPAGTIRWRARAVTILQGALGYDVSVRDSAHEVSGHVAAGLSAVTVSLDGAVGAPFINRWLAPYDIVLSGDFTLHRVDVTWPYDADALASGTAAGEVTWTGGPIRYRLADRNYAGELPPLVAYLGDALETQVYPKDGQTPLLRADIRPGGFVRIGVTQLLTRLAGNPWPGAHADHEIVLEVEEQLF
jgi:hypothetical protein